MNQQPKERSAAFVGYLFDRCQKDKGFAARLRRADNPATEYQCWDTLAAFGVNLEFTAERQPFALIAAALARSKININGTSTLGQAIAGCYEEGNKSDQAKARLRRLLACDQTDELCRILRPLLSLIQNRAKNQLDYALLLSDVCRFFYAGQSVKARWAQQFYGKSVVQDAEDQ